VRARVNTAGIKQPAWKRYGTWSPKDWGWLWCQNWPCPND